MDGGEPEGGMITSTSRREPLVKSSRQHRGRPEYQMGEKVCRPRISSTGS